MSTHDSTASLPTPSAPHVTVIGGGVIGSSWAALFLAHGMRVTLNDSRPEVEQQARELIAGAAPALASAGLDTSGLTRRFRFETDLARAVADADVIQESGPDALDFKRSFFRDVERLAKPGALLLSSTSSRPASQMGTLMKDPARLVVGHPFNPPHMLPLVEVVPGPDTARETVDEAMTFYRAAGRHPVLISKEIPAFVGNRLQGALLREAIALCLDGAITAPQVDELMRGSLGIRWASEGPFLSFFLGGGHGGFAHMLREHGGDMVAHWKSMTVPEFTEDNIRTLSEQLAPYAQRATADLEAERDARQTAVLLALAATEDPAAA
uniref:L-gulonate 3-dehydrogenase n=1 Tax=Streptomyces sp. NBC_00008 TaxID=2903610 RepID=A0AAU2VTH9_9ACTN